MTTAWPEVRLEEVADVRLGRQRSPKNHDGPEMRPYVRAANVGWRGLLLDDVKRMNFTDAEMVVYGLQPGDLLLNEASGSAREVGKPAIWSGEINDCAFQNTLIRVRPAGAEPRYLLHYFAVQASSGSFARKSRGVGIYHLGREALAAWRIPLPPIEEQRRIAAVLDQADELRAKRQTSLALLDSLNETIFLEMFGDSNDVGQPLANSFAEKPIFGSMIPPSAEGSWLALRVGNIQNSRLDLRDRKYVELSPGEVERHSVRDGDLLMARAIASVDHLGKCIVARPQDDERWAFDSHLMRIRLDPTVLLPEFLKQWLTTPVGRNAFLRIARRSSVQFNINTKEIARLEVPTPPMSDQLLFLRRHRMVESQRQGGLNALNGLNEVFAALQHRAFAGQL